MKQLRAFVGHSFSDEDKDVIKTFLEYFDSIGETIDFKWDHAEKAELKELSRKVKEKMKGKNLFIGIFTRKDYRIDPSTMKKGFLRKRKCTSNKEIPFGTSDWIIQESGYALANKMHPLFLIEKGVRLGAGLQGAVEYIEFEREKPTASFPILHEMIGSILEKESSVPTAELSTVAPENGKKGKMEESEVEEVEVEDGTPRPSHLLAIRHLKALIKAVNEQKDLDKGKAELEGAIKAFKDDERFSETYWRSLYFYLKATSGFSEGFGELKILCEQNPDNANVLQNLADVYLHYQQYSDAASQYLLASERVNNRNSKIRHLTAAATCHAQDGDFERAYGILLDEFAEDGLGDSQLNALYKKLAEVANLQENNYLFVAFAEKALTYTPSDSKFRFILAHHYNEKKNNPCALYHYELLCNTDPDDGTWNNLGVCCVELEMPSEAIRCYEVAAKEFGSSLAVSNLGARYINEGFLTNARDILEKESAKEGHDSTIDGHLARINDVHNAETKKKQEILADAKATRKFMADYAESYVLPGKPTIDGKWSSRHGEIQFEAQGNKALGRGEFHLKGGDFGLALRLPTLEEEPGRTKVSIDFSGRINNWAIDYKITITKQSTSTQAISTSLLGGISPKGTVYNGLICISKDSTKMSAMERKGDDEEPEFYEMKQIPEV